MFYYISPLARVRKVYVFWKNHIPLVNHLAKLALKTLFTVVFSIVWKKYKG